VQSSKSHVLLVGALIVGAFVGVLLGFVFDDGAPERPIQDNDSSSTGPGPTDEINGVPVGYARSEQGAVAAAANFSLVTANDALLDADALASAMETLAAPEWQEEARTQAANGYQFVLDRYGEGADVTGAVLRYEVAEFAADRAVIKLWTVSIASGPLRPNPEEVWGVVTVDLVWTEGDWRVSRSESSPGPSPVDLPTREPEESVESVLEDFDEFSRAPTP
jgi:hypothetical protein